MHQRISKDRELIYQTPEMQGIMEEINRFAPTDEPILITGSNGTGKENVAQLIHMKSKRAAHPFVTLNSSAISEALIESELFGHEKGSYTGACTMREGKFEQAGNGTLFLDEIGDMPMPQQAKLLRVLDGSEFTRVGGNTPIHATPRIIAATNKNIKKAIEEGELREDLYYRLCGLELKLPDLSQRPDDIPLLARNIISKTAAKYGFQIPELSGDAINAMMQYAWPGNVRELEQCLKQATIRSQDSHIIRAGDLSIPAGAPITIPAMAGPLALEDSFGYQLFTHRENRGWTQAQLAENVNHHSDETCTQADVASWEQGHVPSQDVVNTLAFLLIANTNLAARDKERALREFYKAAQATHESMDTAQSNGKAGHSFGDMLSNLREKAGLTGMQLAGLVQEVGRHTHMELRDIYLLEHNHPERRATGMEVLAIVKALDTAEYALTAQEKIGLYESAKQLLPRVESAVRAESPEGKMKEQLNRYRENLRCIFSGEEGFPGTGKIAEEIGVQPGIISTLMGNPKKEPTRAISLGVEKKLAEYLEKHDKPAEDIDAFYALITQMRRMTNYCGRGQKPATNGKG